MAESGYIHLGTVTSVGDEPMMMVQGFGELRFAYRIVRRRACETKKKVKVGDCFTVRVIDGKIVGIRLKVSSDDRRKKGPPVSTGHDKAIRQMTLAPPSSSPAARSSHESLEPASPPAWRPFSSRSVWSAPPEGLYRDHAVDTPFFQLEPAAPHLTKCDLVLA